MTGAPEMLADVNQAPVATEVRELWTKGDIAYYVGDSDAYGLELWRTDGSVEGTKLVKDITPGPASSQLRILETIGDQTYLSVSDLESESRLLWVTNGTEEGTRQLVVLPGHYIETIAVTQDHYYFTNGSDQLWVSDGTATGTMKIAERLPHERQSAAYDGRLFFAREDGLWSSGGTQESTQRVTHLAGITGIYAFEDGLYITRRTPVIPETEPRSAKAEIWFSDGSHENTERIFDANELVENSSIPSLTKSSGKLFFVVMCKSGIRCDRSIYSLEDTQESLQRVGSIGSFGGGREVRFDPIEVNGQLFYIDGYTFQKIDASSESPTSKRVDGVQVVGDRLTLLDQTIYVNGLMGSQKGLFAIDSNSGEATHAVDFTSEDIAGSALSRLSAVGDSLYFVTSDSPYSGGNSRVWKSDGTQANTTLLAKLDHMHAVRFEDQEVLALGSIDGDQRVWNISGEEPIGLNPQLQRNQGIGSRALIAARGGKLYFQGRGRIWESDGTSQGTVATDFEPASEMLVGQSKPRPKYLRQGESIFYGAHGSGLLYATDLNTGAHRIVADLGAPSERSDPRVHLLGVTSDQMFVGHSNGVWKSDGTADGTIQLTDAAIPYGSPATEFAGEFYFVATSEEFGSELWKTDGTPIGTSMVADIFPGVGGSSIEDILVTADTLFFIADDGIHGREVWAIRHDGELPIAAPPPEQDKEADVRVTPGESQGEFVLLHDINRVPFAYRDQYSNFYDPPEEPRAAAGNSLFFVTHTNEAGYELWKADGTDGGTQPVKDINPGPGNANPNSFEVLGDVVFFRANSANSRTDLWRTDGTESGTFQVSLPEDVESGWFEYSAHDDSLYLRTDDGLFVSDQNATEWHLLEDTDRYDILVPAGETMFLISFGFLVSVLTRTEGVLHRRTLQIEPWEEIMSAKVRNDKLFFTAVGCYDLDCEGELWSSDGTEEGTTRVMQATLPNMEQLEIVGDSAFTTSQGHLVHIDLGAESPEPVVISNQQVRRDSLVGVGELVFFQGYSEFSFNSRGGNGQLWASDGTKEGTRPIDLVGEYSSAPSNFTVVGDRLFFTTIAPNGDSQLRVVEGNEDRSNSVLASFEFATTFASNGSELYFIAIESLENPEPRVWVSDGTIEGTAHYGNPITATNRGSSSNDLFVLGEELYFAARDGNGNQEIWKTGGSAETTRLATQLPPGANISSSVSKQFGTSQYLFIRGGSGRTLWSTDGTTVSELLNPTERQQLNAANASLRPLTATENLAFFTSSSFTEVDGIGTWSTDIWVSDGTANGTQRITSAVLEAYCDELPYSRSAASCHEPDFLTLEVGDNQIFFAGFNDDGISLWVSDGTEAGTHSVAQSNLLSVSSMAEINGMILLMADDGERGQEPWLYNPRSTQRLGDTNLDGAINFADFLILSANFGKEVDAVWADGDFDGDGKVAFTDFLIFSVNFGTPG